MLFCYGMHEYYMVPLPSLDYIINNIVINFSINFHSIMLDKVEIFNIIQCFKFPIIFNAFNIIQRF